MCSQIFAKPVRPGVSFFESMWYRVPTVTIGVDLSGWRTTCIPFFRLNSLTSIGGSLSACWAATVSVAASANAVSMPVRIFLVRISNSLMCISLGAKAEICGPHTECGRSSGELLAQNSTQLSLIRFHGGERNDLFAL